MYFPPGSSSWPHLLPSGSSVWARRFWCPLCFGSRVWSSELCRPDCNPHCKLCQLRRNSSRIDLQVQTWSHSGLFLGEASRTLWRHFPCWFPCRSLMQLPRDCSRHISCRPLQWRSEPRVHRRLLWVFQPRWLSIDFWGLLDRSASWIWRLRILTG